MSDASLLFAKRIWQAWVLGAIAVRWLVAVLGRPAVPLACALVALPVLLTWWALRQRPQLRRWLPSLAAVYVAVSAVTSLHHRVMPGRLPHGIIEVLGFVALVTPFLMCWMAIRGLSGPDARDQG